MSKQLLTLSTVRDIPNGEEAITEFDRLIRVAAEDCRNRPGVTKNRKVMLQLDFSPDDEQILISVSTKSTLPSKSAGLARGTLDRSGKLFVNPASAGDAEQGTLDDA